MKEFLKILFKWYLWYWGITIVMCLLYFTGMCILILIGHGLHVLITGESPNYVTGN